MAPKKEKPEKSSSEDGTKLILNYLRQQNRPYSALDISSNLHNKVTKGFAVKALKDMHERGEVEGKVSGKQSVYHAIQDPVEDLSPEYITKLNEDIETLRSDLSSVKERERSLRNEIAALNAHISTTDLQESVAKLETERQEILARLAPMRQSSANARVVSEQETARIEQKWLLWKKRVTQRKKICRELWERCTEVVDSAETREEVWESLGLDSHL